MPFIVPKKISNVASGTWQRGIWSCSDGKSNLHFELQARQAVVGSIAGWAARHFDSEEEQVNGGRIVTRNQQWVVAYGTTAKDLLPYYQWLEAEVLTKLQRVPPAVLMPELFAAIVEEYGRLRGFAVLGPLSNQDLFAILQTAIPKSGLGSHTLSLIFVPAVLGQYPFNAQGHPSLPPGSATVVRSSSQSGSFSPTPIYSMNTNLMSTNNAYPLASSQPLPANSPAYFTTNGQLSASVPNPIPYLNNPMVMSTNPHYSAHPHMPVFLGGDRASHQRYIVESGLPLPMHLQQSNNSMMLVNNSASAAFAPGPAPVVPTGPANISASAAFAPGPAPAVPAGGPADLSLAVDLAKLQALGLSNDPKAIKPVLANPSPAEEPKLEAKEPSEEAKEPMDDVEAPEPSAPPADETTVSATSTSLTTTTDKDDKDECKICFEKEIDCIILDCAHHCVCFSCSQGLKTCPICRKDIRQVLKIFKC